MTGYKIGMAEEAVIADLTAKLAKCQAREAKLREALEYYFKQYPHIMKGYILDSLALPHDDTALKEYRKKVLLETANELADTYPHLTVSVQLLRRMAEE